MNDEERTQIDNAVTQLLKTGGREGIQLLITHIGKKLHEKGLPGESKENEELIKLSGKALVAIGECLYTNNLAKMKLMTIASQGDRKDSLKFLFKKAFDMNDEEAGHLSEELDRRMIPLQNIGLDNKTFARKRARIVNEVLRDLLPDSDKKTRFLEKGGMFDDQETADKEEKEEDTDEVSADDILAMARKTLDKSKNS